MSSSVIPNVSHSRRAVLRGAGAIGASAAAASALAACGSGSSASAKTTISMWHWDTAFQDQYTSVIAAYEKANPNVTIKPHFEDFAAYSASLQAALAANNAPDMYYTATFTISLAKAGKLLDLKKALGDSFTSQFFDSANAISLYNGGQYAIPWNAQSFGMFYNKSLMAKAGVEPPETWDDLIRIAPIIRAKTGVTPVSLQGLPTNSLADFMLPMLTQVTNDPNYVLELDALTKSGLSWDNPNVAKVYTKIRQIIDAKAFDPGVLAVDQQTSFDTFTNGKAAMFFTGSFYLPNLHQTETAAFKSNYAIAETPSWAPGGKHWTANQTGETFAVNSKTKNVDEVLKWIKYLYDPTRYMKMMNATASMPATKTGATQVQDPDTKEMVGFLLKGNGAPHILFGQGSFQAVSNTTGQVFQGSVSPEKAGAALQAAVLRTRKQG